MQALYGHFIALSGDQSIDCPQEIIGSILSNLWPAYEDLFDSAEEYVLKILLSQWMSMVVSEAKILDMVVMHINLCYIHVDYKIPQPLKFIL